MSDFDATSGPGEMTTQDLVPVMEEWELVMAQLRDAQRSMQIWQDWRTPVWPAVDEHRWNLMEKSKDLADALLCLRCTLDEVLAMEADPLRDVQDDDDPFASSPFPSGGDA